MKHDCSSTGTLRKEARRGTPLLCGLLSAQRGHTERLIPPPLIHKTLQQISKAKWFTKVDVI
jgi:hypothetical protein